MTDRRAATLERKYGFVEHLVLPVADAAVVKRYQAKRSTEGVDSDNAIKKDRVDEVWTPQLRGWLDEPYSGGRK